MQYSQEIKHLMFGHISSSLHENQFRQPTWNILHLDLMKTMWEGRVARSWYAISRAQLSAKHWRRATGEPASEGGATYVQAGNKRCRRWLSVSILPSSPKHPPSLFSLLVRSCFPIIPCNHVCSLYVGCMHSIPSLLQSYPFASACVISADSDRMHT